MSWEKNVAGGGRRGAVLESVCLPCPGGQGAAGDNVEPQDSPPLQVLGIILSCR